MFDKHLSIYSKHAAAALYSSLLSSWQCQRFKWRWAMKDCWVQKEGFMSILSGTPWLKMIGQQHRIFF